MSKITLPVTQRDLHCAAEAMQEKSWRDAIKPTEATNDILYPGWRDELRKEVEKLVDIGEGGE